MDVRADRVRHTLEFFRDIDLLSTADIDRVLWLFAADFPFRPQLESADSIHLHVKVADTAQLPRDAILNAGGRPESEQAGYVKYVFPAAVNMIFSSIPVAEDDRLPDARAVAGAFLDHAGIDIRQETGDTRRRFDAIVDAAGRAGWRHVAQGGVGRAVYCCHTEVGQKHWVYPPAALRVWVRPLEFAFGPLVIHAGKAGCDLRPIDPAHPRTRDVGCCGSDKVTTSETGALSAREKALIALAVASAKPMTDGIDLLTARCIEAGATLGEIDETLHVAAATTSSADFGHNRAQDTCLVTNGIA